MKYIKIENKSENKTADNSKILKAYKDEVNKFARKIETDEISVAEYFLYDIDHDGIIELIIKGGTCEADYAYTIYTYSNQLVEIGKTPASHSALEVDPDGVGIYRNTAHIGAQHIERLIIDDYEIKEEKVMEST
ncbi:hypothetical protein PND93_07345 [Faecalicoccus pleomorphus]|uniref:hypothetical protein n=1 Tax=Faecalicoccus pleomorphus TaxID=1323 RepID=UPI00232C3E2A|nr:hypothetical protein [Faecalicoccus pleomorphus]MDB7987393.1 hypothetical protein [Faecalicoccus pleomorphus]MDB7991401.1 hypothetical protein [Faecalicoccus pleomorphus]